MATTTKSPLRGGALVVLKLFRLLIPPDGITLESGAEGKLLGNAWMALSLSEEKDGPDVPTGNQCWTLFLNAGNFQGPVAFYIPETWSRLSKGYPTIIRRGLDARPGKMGSGAMEVNTVPCFEAKDAEGTVYARIAKIRFSANDRGESILMRDVKFYAEGAVAETGRFNMDKSWSPNLRANPLWFRQGKEKVELSGLDQWASTMIFGSREEQAFGLKWKELGTEYHLPQYYRQDGSQRSAIAASEVPASTKLTEQAFDTRASNAAYTSPAKGAWINPGPKSAPMTASLTDGPTITFAWYRFVDQPSIQAAGWSPQQRARMQNRIELLHRRCHDSESYMPPPRKARQSLWMMRSWSLRRAAWK